MLACVVQVYFEQFLPTDNSWPEQFGVETEQFRVLVAPRHHGDALFPEDIDRTLATMEFTLTPLSRPGGQVVTRVGERMVDRIGLTVIDDSTTPEPMSLRDVQMDEMVDTALEVAAGIIAHCRVVSESPWLRGVRREHRPQDQRLYTVNPHTETWFAGDDATCLAPLAVYEGAVNASASSGAIRSPEAKPVVFGKLHLSLETFGREPDVVCELLVTAEERLIQLQLLGGGRRSRLCLGDRGRSVRRPISGSRPERHPLRPLTELCDAALRPDCTSHCWTITRI
jgi:hypothetical protein